MYRWNRVLLVSLTLTTLLAAGCGSDATSPDEDDLFDAASVFTEEEVVAQRDSSATRLRLLRVKFRAGTAEFLDGSLETLDRFAEVFANLPGARYEVEGHTDSAGSSSYNLTLSRDRANAVRDYLVSKSGISGGRLKAVGYGFSRPKAPNDPVHGNHLNRRVEVYIRGLDKDTLTAEERGMSSMPAPEDK